MPWFQLKTHQNAFGGHATPGLSGKAHNAPTDPKLDSMGPTFKGKGGGMRPILYPDLGG